MSGRRFYPTVLGASASIPLGLRATTTSQLGRTRREAMLDTAERLFADRGLLGVQLNDVAVAAGLSIPAARSHLTSKQMMLEGVLDRHIDTVIDRIRLWDDATPEPDPVERLTNSIQYLLETFVARGPGQRVYIAALHGAPPLLLRSLRIRQRHVTYFFCGLIGAAVPGLLERSDLTMPLALSLVGMACWHVLWFRDAGALSRRNYARLLTLMVVEGAEAAMREGVGTWQPPAEADQTPNGPAAEAGGGGADPPAPTGTEASGSRPRPRPRRRSSRRSGGAR